MLNSAKYFLLDIQSCNSTLVFYELNLSFRVQCVLSNTFDLVLNNLSAFQEYLFKQIQLNSRHHTFDIRVDISVQIHYIYPGYIVCRRALWRALLVGLQIVDVIDQITYLRQTVIILENFSGVTNYWLKSSRTLNVGGMWVDFIVRFLEQLLLISVY